MRNFWLLNHPNFQILESEELTTNKRLEIEQYFIGLLKSYQPFGLNISKENIQPP